MNSFLDKNGLLNIDASVAEIPSFKRIMEDNVVTAEELTKQAEDVTGLIRKLESTCNEEQINLVKELISEMSVLYMAYHISEIQSM